jgi:hypothetical protein
MLLSVPIELSSDDVDLMSTAQEAGYVSEPLMLCLRQWPAERFRAVINVLLHEGVVWIDNHVPGEGLCTCIYPLNTYSLMLRFYLHIYVNILCIGEIRYEFPGIQGHH